MPDDIYVKYYFGESADIPEVDNGKILFETNTHALYADHNNQRIRYNPPADWNENDENSPSYIANKPEINSVLFSTSQELTDTEKMQVRENIGITPYMFNFLKNFTVDENGYVKFKSN